VVSNFSALVFHRPRMKATRADEQVVSLPRDCPARKLTVTLNRCRDVCNVPDVVARQLRHERIGQVREPRLGIVRPQWAKAHIRAVEGRRLHRFNDRALSWPSPRPLRNLCTRSTLRHLERRVEGPGRVEGTISAPPTPGSLEKC